MAQLLEMKEFRKAHGLTLEKLARQLNFSLSYVSQVENGHAAPAYGFIRRFKSLYPEISIDKIFFSDTDGGGQSWKM